MHVGMCSYLADLYRVPGSAYPAALKGKTCRLFWFSPDLAFSIFQSASPSPENIRPRVGRSNLPRTHFGATVFASVALRFFVPTLPKFLRAFLHILPSDS